MNRMPPSLTERIFPACMRSYRVARPMPSAWAASLGRYSSCSMAVLPAGSGSVGFVAGGPFVVAGASGGRQGQHGVASGAPAHPGPGKGGDGDDGLVAAVAKGGRVLAAAVVSASLAQGPEGGGVAAAFGGEVATEAEH